MDQQAEYLKLRTFLEGKTKALWEHEVKDQKEKGEEPKNYYQSGFSISNICSYESPSGPQFYIAWTNSFRNMVYDGAYYKSFLRYPKRFGTGNAEDVLSALYSSINNDGQNFFNWTIERYTEYLRGENCCYVVRKEGDSFSQTFLRIDLFRKIEPNCKTPENKEFIGGLFHVLDHFSIKGKNLGTGKDVFDVGTIMDVVLLCINAFANLTIVNEQKASGMVDLNESHSLKIAFYRESESGALYIKTAYPFSKKKEQE